MEDKPIKPLDITPSVNTNDPIMAIPRRRKSTLEPAVLSNGHSTNGTSTTNGDTNTNGKRSASGSLDKSEPSKKRSASSAFDENTPSKRSKPSSSGASVDDNLIVVDDAADGAIVIDDD
jgi:ubiquitin-like 1-activating enzyme E1 B